MSTRIVRITGGRDRLRSLLMDLTEQLAGDDEEVEGEVEVPSNSSSDPAVLLNLNSSDCELDEELLVEYEEIAT